MNPPLSPPDDRGTNLAIFATLWCALAAWQVVTARSAHLPTLATLVGLAKGRWATRWFLLLAWGWLGWHLFVRTTY